MWENILSAIEFSDSQLTAFYLADDPALAFEQNRRNETLLHFAARHANSQTIQELIKRGARADIADDFGWTPLHEACKHGNEDAIIFFIKIGTNINFRSHLNETPLHIASRHNFPRIVARLIDAGADPDVTNNDGNTPLHLAIQRGQTCTVNVLIAAGASTDAQNQEGYPPLHLAARHGRYLCADLLLAANVDPDHKDSSGRTFIEVARNFGNETFLLLINARSQNGAGNPDDKAEARQENVPLKTAIAECLKAPSRPQEEHNRSQAISALGGFFFGNRLGSVHGNFSKLIESLLWFAIFPLLLFLTWKGFESSLIPPLIDLDITFASQLSADFVKATANWLLLFGVSCLLVESGKAEDSMLHFFKDLREAVFFRAAHFAIIATYFCKNMTVHQAFIVEFAVFWVLFMILYSISYILWWSNIHNNICENTPAEQTIQNYNADL